MHTFSWRMLRLPLMLSLLWCLLLFALFRWTVQREDEYAIELARLQTETLFTSIVDTRAWNAGNGGVWVRESPASPPNPSLPEQERTLRDEHGQLLVKINPAYMTRQIAEIFSSDIAGFRISSLAPMRAENLADPWESKALRSFEKGGQDLFELTPGGKGMLYRYMAPLPAKESCLSCHPRNKAGDILGGISVSLSADPLLQAAAERKRTTGLAFGIIGIIGVVGIGGATFQINRKRELAEAANRAKSAFLANMTHDMRTPLTGIAGMTELLEKETREPRHRHLLSNLKEATDSLLALVDGIMRYALLEADRQPSPCMPFSLRPELEDCLSALRPACISRDIRLSLIVDDAVPDRLEGDGFRLRQALGNLLGNAVKFTEKGSVTLRVLRKDAGEQEGQCFLAFQVIDTGMGIPASEQERIFERFEQGSAPKSRGVQPETGVGLGLAIARNIARRFKGDLTLSSTPGMGSVFTFTARFALAEPEGSVASCRDSGEESAPAVVPAGSHPRRRILVVEDSPVTALFQSETLTQAGYAVQVAGSGKDAMRLLGRERYEAVLLDLRLPDMGGLDIAGKIRAGELGVAPDMPLLVLSATLGRDDEEAFRKLGINRWMLKPVRADRLARAVGELLPPGGGQAAEDVPPADRPAEPQPAVFDLKAAMDALGSEALLRRLAAIFLSEEGKIRTTFQTLAEQPETLSARCAELRIQAHSLKNGAGMLALDRLSRASAELEDAAVEPEGRPLAELLCKAAEELELASAALRQYCGE